MSFLSVAMLGIAVSFDGFGAGFAFGLKKLRIPPMSLFIICAFSAAFVYSSMRAGALVSGLFCPVTASIIGGVILILVGAFIIRQALESKTEPAHVRPSGAGKNPGAPSLAVILRNPSLADCDNSGTISAKEAMLLGLTLALDALGAGFGAAMIGISPAAASLAVALSKFVFVSAGLYLGKRYADGQGEMRAAAFSGLILVIIGLSHLSNSLLNR